MIAFFGGFAEVWPMPVFSGIQGAQVGIRASWMHRSIPSDDPTLSNAHPYSCTSCPFWNYEAVRLLRPRSRPDEQPVESSQLMMENLTEKQEMKLSELLKYNLKSIRAYLLKEDFQNFWEYVSPTWAEKFLDRWTTRVMRSKIEPLKREAKTLRKHKELILNWFRAKKAFSSGIVEGLNNKVKLTVRKSYGFRTFKCTEIALYHALGKLPEPNFTHEFY